jgi:hypothetical protein
LRLGLAVAVAFSAVAILAEMSIPDEEGSSVVEPGIVVQSTSDRKPVDAGQSSIRQLADAFEETSPSDRAAAFRRSRRNSGGLNDASAVLDLLERENAFLEAFGRQNKESVAVSTMYGEDYTEYVGELLDECNARCDKQDPRTIGVLARSPYNSGSQFAKQLAREHGVEVLPLMLERARSDLTTFRHGAVEMLGTIARFSPGLSQAQQDSIRQVVIAAAKDEKVPVRHGAVNTLGEIGDARDIALLQTIAERDAAADVYPNVTRYPVREAALRALARIRERQLGQ